MERDGGLGVFYLRFVLKLKIDNSQVNILRSLKLVDLMGLGYITVMERKKKNQTQASKIEKSIYIVWKWLYWPDHTDGHLAIAISVS